MMQAARRIKGKSPDWLHGLATAAAAIAVLSAQPALSQDEPSEGQLDHGFGMQGGPPTLYAPDDGASSAQSTAALASVLVIMAHPDDEITIAPILARIVREGGNVAMAFATSGNAGPGISGLEPGEELGELRENEARCSAFALGLPEPEFWKLDDGGLSQKARLPDSAANTLTDRITSAIAAVQPRTIMTWGPDGGYGHADHRMVSSAVTQVVQSMDPDRPDLLYTAFPDGERGSLPGFEGWSTTHPSLITDRIRYQPPDLDAARIAIDCHQSQFGEEARRALPSVLHRELWQGTVYFRLAFAASQ